MVVSFDCLCCYDTFDNVADDLLVECNAKIGHKLCKECFQSFVREELDGKNNPSLACAGDTECNSRYGELMLARSLPADLKERLDKASYLEMVATFDDIWTCKGCDSPCFVDRNFCTTAFCSICNGVEYCIHCRRVAHPSQSCEDVSRVTKKSEEPKTIAEEAMSAAVIRKCPKCSTSFVKWDGCNRIICTRCQTNTCYLCKLEISGYEHFCKHKSQIMQSSQQQCPENCGRDCALWTSAEVREVIEKEWKQEAAETALKAAGINDKQIIDSLIASSVGSSNEGTKE